jgi:Glycosyltransferase
MIDIYSVAKILFFNSEHTSREFDGYFGAKWHGWPGKKMVLGPERILKHLKLSEADNGDIGALSQMERKPELRVLFVGGLNRRKNLAVVIEALGTNHPFVRRIKLEIVAPKGSIPSPELVRALDKMPAERRAELRFYDQVTDAQLLRLYELTDVVVVPSIAEGLGLPVLEALEFGKPVVVSGGSAMSEWAGLGAVHIVNGSRPEEWRDKLEQIYREGSFCGTHPNLSRRYLDELGRQLRASLKIQPPRV